MARRSAATVTACAARNSPNGGRSSVDRPTCGKADDLDAMTAPATPRPMFTTSYSIASSLCHLRRADVQGSSDPAPRSMVIPGLLPQCNISDEPVILLCAACVTRGSHTTGLVARGSAGAATSIDRPTTWPHNGPSQIRVKADVYPIPKAAAAIKPSQRPQVRETHPPTPPAPGSAKATPRIDARPPLGSPPQPRQSRRLHPRPDPTGRPPRRSPRIHMRATGDHQKRPACRQGVDA